MRSIRTVSLIVCGLVLLGSAVRAQVLQSSARAGSYWMVHDGGKTRLNGPEGAEMRIDLPPGAVLYDLEPTNTGWLAAGRMPTTDGSELLIIEGRHGETDLISVPSRSGGKFRGQPVLLIDQDRLVGLVWAEGDGHDQLAIWAAPWNEDRWGAPELVSPQGPGSQLAPVAAVLDDGSWLAVWPAFDGVDDEIRWSRRVGGEWSSPERVHDDNNVPDLTPDVIAIDGGALVVWSWFDGNDYRLRRAQLTQGVWSDAESFGERGSVDPGFIQAGDRIRLLYQTVAPATWTVLELDRNGVNRRQAVLLVETNDRPFLFAEEDYRARLHWPELERRDQPSIDHRLEWHEQQ